MRANDIPSTDAIRWGYGEHYLGDILFSDPDEIRAENVYIFDQWLAKHDREVKAQALTEAADAMDADPDFRDPLRLKSDWVRNRAQQLAEADREAS